MDNPMLVIEASPTGVDSLVIHMNRKNPEVGFAFLQKVLPVLGILDRQIRDPEGAGNPDGKENQ